MTTTKRKKVSNTKKRKSKFQVTCSENKTKHAKSVLIKDGLLRDDDKLCACGAVELTQEKLNQFVRVRNAQRNEENPEPSKNPFNFLKRFCLKDSKNLMPSAKKKKFFDRARMPRGLAGSSFLLVGWLAFTNASLQKSNSCYEQGVNHPKATSVFQNLLLSSF